MTDPDADRRLVQEQWDAFNRGDMAAASECFASDTCSHGCPVGRAGVLAVLGDIQTTFPDVRFTPLDYLADGEWVVVRGTFRGTRRGSVGYRSMVGCSPASSRPGRRFEVQHIHMMQIREGSVLEHFANRDDLGTMQQLGLLS
jgi:predicted ester cyclase